jgi:hypothetical protein
MNDSITTTRDWVPEPDGRGTWGILSTCVLTIILCCWTSVSPNLPAPSDGTFRKWRYKFDLACIAILGSEFLLMLALGQWSSARCSVKVGYKLVLRWCDVEADGAEFLRGWI